MEEANATFNNILMSLLKELYTTLGPSDLSSPLSVTLKFDDSQRITSFLNLKVGDKLTSPSPGLAEKLNLISQQILELPDTYKLKECKLSVEAGGKMDFAPVYLVS